MDWVSHSLEKYVAGIKLDVVQALSASGVVVAFVNLDMGACNKQICYA